jgi:hypothetical protein
MKKPTLTGLTRFLLLAAAVIIVFLIVFINLATIDRARTEEIHFEILKSLLELLVITVSGAYVGLLVNGVEDKRIKDRVADETRTKYLKRLGEQYRKVKTARRMLRGHGLSTKNGSAIPLSAVTAPYYYEQIKVINHAQLEFEGLAIEASKLPEFITFRSIKANLTTMQEYLNLIVSEFEEKNPLLQQSVSIPFDDFGRLKEFTGKIPGRSKMAEMDSAEYHFKESFSDVYESTVGIISESMEEKRAVR